METTIKTEKQLLAEAKRTEKLEKFLAKQEKQAKEKLQAAERKLNATATGKQPPQGRDKVEIIVDFEDTPFGQKKNLNPIMSPAYNPKNVEKCWYSWWESSGYFKPEIISSVNPNAEPFVIAIPPPNVTGSLHLGHAMGLSIQDAIIRAKRMQGYAALYIPGCDHAGISCQVVVEKQLWKTKKKTRHDLGRKDFIDEVWKWKNQYGDRIYDQFRKLGASLDWSREIFTLDNPYNVAVQNTFIQLFEDGIVYRDNRLVNWSGQLQTTVSDLEVDNKELTCKTMLKAYGHDPKKEYPFGVLYDVAYRMLDDEANEVSEIVICTTRPETIPGDVAVAVHPDDPRYKRLHGKYLAHPLTGNPIPIITDAIIADMTFGTGAVKITPAHDHNDFEAGIRHNLAFVNVLTDDNRMSESCGIPELVGLPRFEARERIVSMLQASGLLRGIKDHVMTLPICNRSGDIIEPRLRPQWWLNCSEMAHASADAVRNGSMSLLPKESSRIWFHWLDNCRDWCLSRQLWWGHQIPAYEVSYQGRSVGWQAASSPEDALRRLCEKGALPPGTSMLDCNIVQDPDVFDTWYSAALWPLVTLGWAGNIYQKEGPLPEDFQKYYPTSLMETGRDIIFFWVARMTMFGLYFTGKVPFSTIFLHSIVRDAHGRKMSKSLGNVVDPLDVVSGISLEDLQKQLLSGNLDSNEIAKAQAGQRKDFPNGIAECGADALRFSLCAYTSPGSDINLDISRVEGYRKFCNKIWNAARFIFLRFETDKVPLDLSLLDKGSHDIFSTWILSRLSRTITDLGSFLDQFNFQKATSAIHAFFLYDFCDVYIEVSKKDPSPIVSAVLFRCLLDSLKLLHPFMPFITEELFQRLHSFPGAPSLEAESISLSRWPKPIFTNLEDEGILFAELNVTRLLDVVKDLRIASKSCKVPFSATIKATESTEAALLGRDSSLISLVKGLKKVSLSKVIESSNDDIGAQFDLTPLSDNLNVPKTKNSNQTPPSNGNF